MQVDARDCFPRRDRDYSTLAEWACAERYAAPPREWGQVQPVIRLYGVPRSPALYYFDDLVISRSSNSQAERSRKCHHLLCRVILTYHVAGVATAWAQYLYCRHVRFRLGYALSSCVLRLDEAVLAKCFANKRDAENLMRHGSMQDFFEWERLLRFYNRMPSYLRRLAFERKETFGNPE